ncbi:MAG: serine/threonine-protein kinase RsbW [Halocynthiibacter sp.]|jgi:serine/threonine-protein kinase RsbW
MRHEAVNTADGAQVDCSPLTAGELRLVFGANPISVRTALTSICDCLRKLSLSDEEVGSVELVLAETLNNIVEHAYSDSGVGEIDVRLQLGERGLYCSIFDNGSTMPGGMPPLGMAADPMADMEDLPEGGFGWFLIRELAKDLQYARAGDRNQVTFRIAVGMMVAAN